MFVRAPNPIWWLPDHVGQPLNDEYYAFFLTNTLPYLPQNVYQDPQGTTIWTGNKIEFSPAGTLPNNLYFDPDLVYRIEIRRGATQFDELIWEINDFVPGEGSSINRELSFFGNENQTSNPQFSQILFASPTTITTAGTYEIAPDWDLVLTGTGSTTLSLNTLDGNSNQINNPPFSLRIANTGWTEVALRQRFDMNGAIWANGAVSMSITVRAQTAPQTVSLLYVPSITNISTPVATGVLTTGSYQVLQGAIDLPASINTDTSDIAYVDMIIQLPPSGTVDISNVQIVGQGANLPTSFDPSTDIPLYQQQSFEREIDHLFNYYQPLLNFKPIPSILTGWDFSLNPAQFGATQTVTGAPAYIWDQTIAASGADPFSIARNPGTGGFEATSTAINSVFYVLQYLTGNKVKELLTSPLSVNVSAFVDSGLTDVTMKVFLYRGSSSAIFPVLPLIIGTLSSNGNYTLTEANWTEIPRGLQGPASATLTGISSNTQLATDNYDYGFSGWQITDATHIGDTDKFAIVVSFVTPTNATKLIIDSISVVPGLIPTRPAPQSADEVLRECQYYYEQSYQPGTVPGTASTNASRIEKLQNVIEGGGNISSVPGPFQIDFKTFKVQPPSLTFYSPGNPGGGTTDKVTLALYNNGAFVASNAGVVFSDNWQLDVNPGLYNAAYVQKTANLFNTTAAAGTAANGIVFFHYVADSRLGTV